MDNYSDNIPSGLTSQEVSDLLGYVAGDSSELPPSLQKLVTNLYHKIQTVAGYSTAAEIQRQARLSRYLAKLEEELFDEDMVSTMSRDDLMETYKVVASEASKSSESTRKWLVQNRDTFNQKTSEIEKLAQQLSTLPPEKLASIQSILKGESLVSSEDTLADL